MKAIIRNPSASWAVRIVLILLGAAIIAGVAFLEGMLYANRKVTVRMANDLCFYSWAGLKAVNDPANRKMTILLDHQMDSAAAKLAEISLSDPRLIERGQYNLLLRVREYRKEYGRSPEANWDLNPSEVDDKIARAIAYLESVHDTNDWFPFKSEGYDIIREIRKAGAISSTGSAVRASSSANAGNNKSVQPTEASRSGEETNRTPTAAGSRR